MALFKDRSITDVVNKLDLALPGSSNVTVAPSAISHARARLGQEPVRWLFERCANKWAHQCAAGDRWRCMEWTERALRVPDSEANQHEFGLIVGRLAPEGSGYPVMRAVALMALRYWFIKRIITSSGPVSYARGGEGCAPQPTRSVSSRRAPGSKLCTLNLIYFTNFTSGIFQDLSQNFSVPP